MAVYRPSALKLTKSGTQDQYIIDLTTRVAVQQAVADAGKALGINDQGLVVPVPFSGSDFTGATETTAGVHGYVPAPAAGDQDKVLFGDGTWKESGSAARLITITHSVVNESGAYSVTIPDERIAPTVECIRYEIGDPSVFRAKPSISCGNGSVTVSCADVVGETTLVMKFIKGTDESQVITSEEFDILDNRIKVVEDVQESVDISIAVADWTLANGVYSYTWESALVTAGCEYDVFLLDGADNAGIVDFNADKVTGGIQFTTTDTPVDALPLKIRIINCTASEIDELKGTYDIPFTIHASDWSQTSPYTYTWLDEHVTSNTGVDVDFYSGADNTEVSYIECERVNGGIQFTSAVLPTSDIAVCAHIDNTLTYNYTSIAANMVSTNAVSGAVNAEEALSALDSKITTQVVSAFNGNNQTWKGQSYNDIFSLSAGKWLVICDYSGDFAGIICKNNSIYGANLFGDISRGGVAYVNINATTTIQIYINTNDTSNYTAYRAIFKAIKLFD